MEDGGWPPEWQRGVLEFTLLAAIDAGEAHGYLISQHLRRAGFGTVKGGTLYPALRRLEELGLVTSQWQEGSGGPGRKVYATTPDGRAHLDARREQWRRFSSSVSTLTRTEVP